MGENGRFAYQPALDGVRAFAVLSVFAYHLDAGWARGGFLGVDTFFVLSGFLITSLLVGEFARLAQIHPDVVIWLSEWDHDERLVDGQNISYSTMSGRFVFARLIDEAATRLTSTGARLVMLTVAPPSPSDSSPDPPKDPTFDYMNRMLSDYARAHADHTSVVDLAKLLCPNGQPCPEEIGGIRPRPLDGNHFEPDTAVWVAHQLMPQIMASTPGSGIEAATPNDARTNASVGTHA